MALIKCPECGKEISDKSKECVHCGFPIKQETSICNIQGVSYDLTDIKNKVLSGDNHTIGSLIKLTNCNPYVAKEIIDYIRTYQEVPKSHSGVSRKQVESNQVRCPKCGSTQITAGARGVNAVCGFIGASKTVNRCMNCGCTFKPKRK